MLTTQMFSFSHFISSSTMDIQISNFLKRAEKNVVLILKTISRYSEFYILKSGDLLFRSTNKKCESRITVNKAYEVINI